MIVSEPIELTSLLNDGNHYYPDMIKFCIDEKRKVICIDEEMHIDMEHMLYDDGSEYSDIYGGNIMLDKEQPYVIWEGHPNIERNKALGGRGREITDERKIDELSDILFCLIK